MNNTTGGTLKLYELHVKAVLSMTPSLLFLYVNLIMIFTLMNKPIFLENPRYILFGHLLLSDSLHLLFCVVMYLLAVTRLKLNNYVCNIVCGWGGIISVIAPLNLAVMSLERYVAICFPLRHTEIATIGRTVVAIAVVWILGSLSPLIELFVFVNLTSSSFTMQVFCSKYTLLRREIFMNLDKAFTSIYFVIVGIIIIYTYIAIMVSAKSASSHRTKASKAHKTVLLHLIQLGLCLSSTLFNTINSMVHWRLDPVTVLRVQYVLFLLLMIFPRCLSPLIYGLRDQAFRKIFRYYFTFGLRIPLKSAKMVLKDTPKTFLHVV